MINESLKNAFKEMWKKNLDLLDISKSDLNSHIHDDNPHHITTYSIGAANVNHTHLYAGSSTAGGSATSVAYEEGTSNQSRHVWFSNASSQGKLVYDNDFKYNPSTNVLTVGSITGTAAKATSDGSGNNIVNTYATKTALKSISDLVGSTSVATQISNALITANTYADNKVASLVDSAPETLNTLNELAAALGDDANFSTTVLNQIGTKANANHTHNYAGSSSAGGSANSAVKLDSSAGSATQPIYFSNGKPTACTYILGKSVPSNAVFTDTVYTHPTTSGNKHIPSGGSSGQILRWSSDGTAVWGSDSDTKNTAGSTDTSSKIFLIGATSQAANPQTYSHNTAYVGTDGCLYSNNTKVSVNGHTHNYITISDTRNDNPAPNSASFIKYALSADFKYVNKINSPSGFGGNYCGLINFAPWGETSGGNGYQIAVGYNTNAHPRLAVRSADLSATSWGSWYKIYTSDDKPTPSDIGAAASSHTHTVANISGLTATVTELNYCDGVTSNIQTQLNNTVKLSGDQTIAGVKTFSNNIVANAAINVVDQDLESLYLQLETT